MLNKEIENLVARFWEECAEPESFPRDLELVILKARPALSTISMAQLSPAKIRSFLARRDHCVSLTTAERWLNGCFYACKSLSFILIEENLSAEWRRAVIAHEFGHCLAHYEMPRRQVARRLGETVLPVLDSARPASPSEQLSATLAGVKIDSYAHFMDRNADGSYTEPVSEPERTAEAVGLELLAPWREVSARVRQKAQGPGVAVDWTSALMTYFGLPPSLAEYYGNRLLRRALGGLTFSQALGL